MTTSSSSPVCQHHLPACSKQLWECKTCHGTFCTTHTHTTSLGTNVECVPCERKRTDAVPPPPRIGKFDAADKLKIQK